MLKTNTYEASVHADPLSFAAGLQVLSGQTVQTYNRDLSEHVPDRTLVPLVLLPQVSVSDPDRQQTGDRPLNTVEWYEGAPKADKSNLITAGTDYEMGDGTVAGFPEHALKVKKNVDPDTPIELFCLFTVTDKRTQTDVLFERSIRLYTAVYDSKNYSVKLNCPRGWTVTPLAETDAADGSWMHALTAQLYSGSDPVPDANAAYWWQVNDSGTWRGIDQDDLDLWITGQNADGTWGKTLRFDARMLAPSASFRVRAAYYEGARPTAPQNEELQAEATVKMEMPPSLQAAIRQTKGMKVRPGMTSPVGYECLLSYNKGPVAEGKYSLFRIRWKAKSAKSGASVVELGEGRTVEFVPAQKGFDPKHALAVYAEVLMFAGQAVVMSGDSALTDASGNYIVADTYE